MEDLWESKGRPYEGDLDDVDGTYGSHFNCVPVELTLGDLEQLEAEIVNKTMPRNRWILWRGFFSWGR